MSSPHPCLVAARRFLSSALAASVLGSFSLPTLSRAQIVAAPDDTADDLRDDRDVTHLSPFVISGEEDEGYRASSTLAGTRIRTNLRDVGSAISVVTGKFLQDTGARRSEDLLVYTTNTEVGGVGGNFSAAGGEAASRDDYRSTRAAPQGDTRVRGLASADNTRDFFLTDIPWDSYNVGRIDLQRGPNSILFGLGSPAGIINASLNTAVMKNSGSVELRYGSYGSHRASLDVNQMILSKELAVRLSALHDKTYYRQDPAYNRDRRLFGALRWEPSFLKKGGAQTSLRVNYERGKIDANRPRTTPPIDALTPWWTELNQTTFDAREYAAATEGPYGDWLTSSIGRVYDSVVAVFPDEKSGQQGGNGMPAYTTLTRRLFGTSNSLSPNWAMMSLNTSAAAENAAGTANAWIYRDDVITDPSIFDFYNRLIDGPNKAERQSFHAANAALSQTFLENRAGIELAFDTQHYEQSQVTMYQNSLYIDLNTTLANGDPNPNVGRPLLAGDSKSNDWTERDREAFRATGYYDLDFGRMLDQSPLSRWLGRHVFTGLYNTQEIEDESRQWVRYATDDEFGNNVLGQANINDSARSVATISYLGPSLLNRNTPAGANIPNLQAVQLPRNGGTRRFFNSAFAPGVDPATADVSDAASYVGWQDGPFNHTWNADLGDIDRLYTNGQKSREKIRSMALIWQGFFLDGNLVPTVGWRSDRSKSFKVLAPSRPNSSKDVHSPEYTFEDEPDGVVEDDQVSWSLVAHLPRAWQNKLPGRTGLSVFYNRSNNFRPAAGRVDFLGNPLPAPSGSTKDYGFVVTTLDDRLTLKVNWYTTEMKNDSYDSVNWWWFGAVEAWGYWLGTQPYNASMTEAWAAFEASPAPQAMQNAYGFVYHGPGNYVDFSTPSGITSVTNSISEGVEFELTAEPVKNWSLTFNAAQTKASRTGIAANLSEYIEQRRAFWAGPAGDLWWWGEGVSTLRDYAFGTVIADYDRARAKEGTAVDELRKWRYNLVTNYTFTAGALKGVNIGAGYRWQDKVVIGYPARTEGARIIYDVTRPYYGPSEDNIDLWIGYERRVFTKYRWRIQLNVRNAFEDDKLIPISTQPNGDYAGYRIPEATTYMLTTTVSF